MVMTKGSRVRHKINGSTGIIDLVIYVKKNAYFYHVKWDKPNENQDKAYLSHYYLEKIK